MPRRTPQPTGPLDFTPDERNDPRVAAFLRANDRFLAQAVRYRARRSEATLSTFSTARGSATTLEQVAYEAGKLAGVAEFLQEAYGNIVLEMRPALKETP